MKAKIIITLSIVFITFNLVAQRRYLKVANKYFDRENYCEGAEKCIKAYTRLSSKSSKKSKRFKREMAFKTAECYRFMENYPNALEWYDRSLTLEYQSVKPEIYLYMGDINRILGKHNEAEKNYTAYKGLVPQDIRADIGLQSCKTFKEFKENKTNYIVKNETSINKPDFDMTPMFGDRKESKFYFSSNRPGSTGTDIDPRTCQGYMDIWVSQKDKKDNWGEPKLIEGKNINTEDNEGTACFDGRNKKMFFTRCPNVKKQNLGCDIWMSEAKGRDEWGEPQKLNLKTSDTISVGHPCASYDGRYLIFASDMPGGYGGKDLWYTSYNKKKDEWETPQNLGPQINTSGNEVFPTFGKDGDLYFASDGMVGMGGLDIFVAKKVGDEYQWENAQNMGYPINSENHDYWLIELTDKKGYFTSERPNPSGTTAPDIYEYVLPPNNFDLKIYVRSAGDKNVKIADAKVTLKGSDGSTYEGYANQSGMVFFDKKPNGDLLINENTTYKITVSKDGYHEDPKGTEITTVGLKSNRNFIIDMSLVPKKAIRLPEVRYPLGQYTLLVDSTINSKDSLNFVYDLLAEYPGMVLELSSHTDARGTDEANQKLSEERAKECVRYLVEEKGVDPRRIVPKGIGEREPATYFDPSSGQEVRLTEEYINQFKKKNSILFEKLHQINRRTEGRVLRMDFNPEEKKVEAPEAPKGK